VVRAAFSTINKMIDFKQHVVEALHKVCPSLTLEQLTVLVEVPPDAKMGDFAFPCFQLAKAEKKNPKQLAEDISKAISCDTKLVERVAATGPYVNFFLNRTAFMAQILKTVADNAGQYGHSKLGQGKTVIVEYSSPNIAKPFGVGHLRTTVIGASLTRIYSALGYKVVGINYLGDWGTQFGKLMEAYSRWGDDAELAKHPIQHLYNLYVRFHKEVETDPTLEDKGRAWFQKLESGDAAAVSQWTRFREESIREFERMYAELGIHFDVYEGESDYPKAADAAVSDLVTRGVAIESEGAIVVPLGDDMPPALLRKQDGTTLYLSRDLAAIDARKKKYHFDKILYVVGSEQILHFKQLKALLEKEQPAWAATVEHIPFGRIQGISTRKGTLVFLEDLLSETQERALEKIREAKVLDVNVDENEVARKVGIGAIVFNDLRTRRVKDVEFSWDKVLSFEGETGPYLQYAYARIGRLMEKVGVKVDSKTDVTPLNQEEAWAITRMLANYPNVIRNAAESNEPSFISTYLTDLASAFSSFYQNHRILGASPEFQKAAMLLVGNVRSVLHHGLTLLGVPPIERM